MLEALRALKWDLGVKLIPSWLDARFGQVAAGLRTGVALGLSVANEEAASEYAASTFKKRPVYGFARYYYGLDAVAYSLKRTLGAPVLNLYGRPYALVNGVLIYPWCYGNSKDLDHREIPIKVISQFKRDLFAARTASRDRAQMWIDFTARDGGMDFEIRGLSPEAEAEAEGESDVRAVLAAYASNPQAGLLRVVFGDVELYSDGHLHWNKEEELAIEDALAGDLTLTRQAIADSLQRFDSRPEPDVDLDLYEERPVGGERIEEKAYEDHSRPDEEEGNQSTNVS